MLDLKIMHVCLCGPVTDGWSYQDNLLPKYHKVLGHEVTVLASEWVFDRAGKLAFDQRKEYINEHGVKTIRIKSRWKTSINSKIRIYADIRQVVDHESPDIIFIHGCQFVQLRDIYQYVKRKNDTRIYVDNHADFSNSASNWLSKNILHKIIWKHCAQMIEPYTTKFYGVLPARVDFLADMYGLPRDKIELLVMGADDELVAAAKCEGVRKSIRERHGIGEDDFLIMTGGKIDAAKKQTLLLMEAIKRINKRDVKLIVFGSVTPELKTSVESLCYNTTIQYIGWIQSNDAYAYFAAADLVVFPGRHSVFWEQVVGLGIPMMVKFWEGTTHIDVGGNCDFLYEDSADEIKNKIQTLIDDPVRYKEMKRVAENRGMDMFSYRSIAEKSIAEDKLSWN